VRVLLDTNTFIWASREPDLLTEPARAAIRDPLNERFVSIASLWEMEIKRSLGKLPLPAAIDTVAGSWAHALSARFLSIELSHVAGLGRLASVHKDPFDRMIAAQALTERMAVVSSDGVFTSYDVDTIW
jgi:PIN domain nuclease of toxin-antitoxin system